MVKVFIIALICIKVSLLKENNVDKEKQYLKMETFIKVIIKMEN